MQENTTQTKETVISILKSAASDEDKVDQLNDLLLTLSPIDNPDGIIIVCNAAISCTEKLGRSEMSAQFCLMKAKAEIAKGTFLIHEMKELTLALGWFAFALKSEKDRYDGLERAVQEIWSNTQKYINAGFSYLNQKRYAGPVASCYKFAGEIYASFYLQLKLYYLNSGRPWKSKIANFKSIRFLGLDDIFSLDKKPRIRINSIKKETLKCFGFAIKYFTQEKAWLHLADSYISLGLEHHSFNNPIRSKFYLAKAEKILKEHNIKDLDGRLLSVKSMPWIGSSRDSLQ